MKVSTKVLTLLAVIAAVAYPQALGDIRGTLSDSTGAVMPGCAITVTNQDTNVVRRTATNNAGAYDVPDLVPGTYSVAGEKSGFQPLVRKDIILEVSQVVRIDLTLQVGQAVQSLEVAANAQMIDTTTTAVATTIENKDILELPLNGRDPLSLVALSPDVTYRNTAQGLVSSFEGGVRSTESISISGMRIEWNNYSIDGIANQDVTYNSYIVRPSIEALLEFKVVTGIFPAEYGREPSQVVFATRSGTNAYHATLFEFLRNSAVDARAWDQVGNKNPFRRNDYGFTFSGPLLKNRLFFLSNYEGLRDRTWTQEIGSPPTQTLRNGDMTVEPQVVYDPLTRVFNAAGLAIGATPFPGNIIPSSRFNSIDMALLSHVPLPNQPTTSLTNNYINQARQPTDTDQFTGRIDFAQNDKMNWFGRYSFDNDFLGGATLLAKANNF